MKKQYIIPNTTSMAFRTEYICQTVVNSVQGVDLNLGGGADPGAATPIDPM